MKGCKFGLAGALAFAALTIGRLCLCLTQLTICVCWNSPTNWHLPQAFENMSRCTHNGYNKAKMLTNQGFFFFQIQTNILLPMKGEVQSLFGKGGSLNRYDKYRYMRFWMLGTQRQGNRQNHEALGNVGNNESATNLSLPLVSILFQWRFCHPNYISSSCRTRNHHGTMLELKLLP